MDILSLFACFETITSSTSVRQLAVIAQAMLSMTGRMTMLNISRWTGKGGSYRTVNRFFATTLDWSQMMVKFFQTHLFNLEDEYILAGDETIVSKSGKETFGIDRFFSGLQSQVIKGLSFFAISLVNVRAGKSYPLIVKQMVRSEEEKAAIVERKKRRKKRRTKKKNKKPRKPKGRPPGSRNKDKTKLELSPELLRIDALVKMVLKLIRVFMPIRYIALDGHFGHNQAVLMVRKNGLQLISKVRRDAVLFEKYEGVYRGIGKPKTYGERLDYERLPKKYLKKSEQKGDILTNYYQAILLSKSFAGELNVVIIEKLNVKTKKRGHAVLFSSDLELIWEKLVKYYSLRFQIEFNFREAKQHFGLEDFMNQTQKGVENAANLSFMMVNVSEKLKKQSNEKCVSTNDLKTHYRGVKYARLVLKKVLKKAEPILINEIIEDVSRLGSIHQPKPTLSSA
jgi:putative transposase